MVDTFQTGMAAVVCASLIGGCVPPGGGPNIKSAPTAAAGSSQAGLEEMERYVFCNIVRSRQFAEQSGDALTLAIASEAACGEERQLYTNAVAASRGVPTAMRLTQVIERTAIRSNAGEIALARAR